MAPPELPLIGAAGKVPLADPGQAQAAQALEAPAVAAPAPAVAVSSSSSSSSSSESVAKGAPKPAPKRAKASSDAGSVDADGAIGKIANLGARAELRRGGRTDAEISPKRAPTLKARQL